MHCGWSDACSLFLAREMRLRIESIKVQAVYGVVIEEMFEMTASFIAGTATILVMWGLLGCLWAFRKHRDVRIRGLRETLEVGGTVAGLASFGVVNVVDQPFCSCTIYALWGIVPIIFVWPAFFLYIARFSRLYALHALRERSSSKGGSCTDVKCVDLEKGASRMKRPIVEWSLAITARQDIRTLVRIWNTAFMLLGAVFFVLFVLHSNFQSTIPDKWEACAEGNMFYFMLFSVMLVEGIFYLALLFGTILDVAEQASRHGDSLGIKRMLVRMALDAALSMTVFMVMIAFLITGNLSPNQVFFCFVPFIASFYVDLVIIPVGRATVAIREQKVLLKKNGVSIDGENLSKIFSIQSDAPAEYAKRSQLFRLQAFLLTEDGYQSFHSHLAAEFGLESLLFIVEACTYATRFQHLILDIASAEFEEQSVSPEAVQDGRDLISDRRIEMTKGLQDLMQHLRTQNSQELRLKRDRIEMVTQCLQIFEKFVAPGAPYEINLPSDITTRFKGVDKFARFLKSGQEIFSQDDNQSMTSSQATVFDPSPTIFDDLIIEVLNLMYLDSFQRWLSKEENARMYKTFVSSSQERMLLADNKENEMMNA